MIAKTSTTRYYYSCSHRALLLLRFLASKKKTHHHSLRSSRRSFIASSSSSSSSRIPFYGAPRPAAPAEFFLKNSSDSDGSTQQQQSSSSSSCLLSLWDRLRLTWNAAVTAAHDPTRADAVAAVGELTGGYALQQLLEQTMRHHPVGRQILRDRPVVSKATIPYETFLQQAREIKQKQQEEEQEGGSNTNITDNITFGQGYGLFLLQHGFDPDERDSVRYLNNEDAENNYSSDRNNDELVAYVMTRYRQCHDFWHVLTGLPPTVAGELGLKWLELFQTGLPVTALSCTAGSLLSLSTKQDRDIVWNVYLPWARRQVQKNKKNNSAAAVNLMNVYYEREWDTPLTELRERLHLEPAPSSPSSSLPK